MTTIQELSAALHPGNEWSIAYPVVAHEARLLLEGTGEALLWTTEDVVNTLWPEALARGDMILRRQRLYKALAALAEHELSDCCTKGPERRLKHGGKMVRPWLWHKPKSDEYTIIARATGVSRDVVKKVVQAYRVEADKAYVTGHTGAPDA